VTVYDAIHQPKGLQPRIPIVVGGNGPKVTWRLAACFADELFLDAPPPQAVARALPVIRARCQEIGRDPADLRVAVHLWASRPPSHPARRGSDGCGSVPTSAWTGWSPGILGRPLPGRPGRAGGGLRRRGATGTGLSRRRPVERRVVLGHRWITVQVSVRVMPSTSWMREVTSLPS
jgi:Luciferase-like monooxygenase